MRYGKFGASIGWLVAVLALLVALPNDQARADNSKTVDGLGLTEEQVVDAYIYVLGRYLVIRQEIIDIGEEGVDYNTIKFNELGKAEFVNPNLDVAYLEAWFAVDENTCAILTVPKVEDRYYTAQIVDEWADILYNINERNFSNKPYGRFGLCLKGANVALPGDVLRLDLPSKKAKMLARVERKGDDETAVRLQRSFKIETTGTPEIDPPVAIPMFTNAEPIMVDAFAQPMVEKLLQSAPDAMALAKSMQERVLRTAAFVCQRRRDFVPAGRRKNVPAARR
jgi:hypothetical protein